MSRAEIHRAMEDRTIYSGSRGHPGAVQVPINCVLDASWGRVYGWEIRSTRQRHSQEALSMSNIQVRRPGPPTRSRGRTSVRAVRAAPRPAPAAELVMEEIDRPFVSPLARAF